MDVIFVAGIHGVGKTTASQELSRRLGVAHLSASSIIKAEKISAVSERSKLVVDVGINQQFLVSGLRKVPNSQRIILDGHFTMRRKSDGCLERVSVDVFREIGVVGIILYVDAVKAISERLFDRDGETQSDELLQLHQEEELLHAKSVAATLRVPLIILPSFEIDNAIAQIHTLIGLTASE